MQLNIFNGKNLVTVEKQMREDDTSEFGEDCLLRSQVDELLLCMHTALAGKVASVKVTTHLDLHPCVVTVEEMAAARHFMRTQSHQMPEENRFALLQPQLEINPKHIIIKKLHKLRNSDPLLADLLTKQLFANAMVGAGLADDSRVLLTTMNDLLAKALEKH